MDTRRIPQFSRFLGNTRWSWWQLNRDPLCCVVSQFPFSQFPPLFESSPLTFKYHLALLSPTKHHLPNITFWAQASFVLVFDRDSTYSWPPLILVVMFWVPGNLLAFACLMASLDLSPRLVQAPRFWETPTRFVDSPQILVWEQLSSGYVCLE